jgi:DNA repair exonuclease SbcCD ATPase subunit
MADEVIDPPKAVPGDQLDGLFHGPLEEFTQARNELAKSLRSDGDGEAADWVKGLTKPSRAAWLVNQLAVRKSDEISELLETGRELRAAQEEMLAGATDRDKLREAARREQKEIDSLLRTAEVIGHEHGVGAQVLTRVGETLQAASSDPDVAEAIEAGRLTREQRAASIGLVGPTTPARSKGKGGRAKERDAKERRDRQQQAKRRKEAERKLATAERNLERERDRLAKAKQSVEQAERRVHEAELDANAARRALDEI